MITLLADQFGASPVKVDNFWDFLNQNIGDIFVGMILFVVVFGFFVFPPMWNTFHLWLLKDKK